MLPISWHFGRAFSEPRSEVEMALRTDIGSGARVEGFLEFVNLAFILGGHTYSIPENLSYLE